MNLSIKLNIQKDTFSLHADLEFPLENITSCFGPSGSGKTTFLRHLAGLEVSDSALNWEIKYFKIVIFLLQHIKGISGMSHKILFYSII